MEAWIEANIFPKDGQANRVLLDFIRPLVEKLRAEGKLVSYHFFFESEIRFRILTEDVHVKDITKQIEEARKLGYVNDIQFKPYPGEEQSFGKDAWTTAHRFFEASSEFALDRIDLHVQKGAYFNAVSFAHYFLNPQGLDQIGEANAHLTMFLERMLTYMNGKEDTVNKKVKELEDRISKMEKAG